MKHYYLYSMLFFLFLDGCTSGEQLEQKHVPEVPAIYQKKSLKLMNQFIYMIQNNSYEESVDKVKQIVDNALLNEKSSALNTAALRTLENAYQTREEYIYPVQITSMSSVDDQKDEVSMRYKFWIARKEGHSLSNPFFVITFSSRFDSGKIVYMDNFVNIICESVGEE